ncbi:restriction endonuclease subunit S (plasmid) [Vibrio parahaemolyticus]|uniref:restriction endonuclease subunit S n=1 Tax=Vibrio parahaemolyticus TaxID=670 RepID=UPI0040552B05
MSFDIQTLSLSEICTDISYGYTASANTEIVGPKFLRITDIQGGVVDWDTVPYCEIPESKLNKNLLSQGDIVVARTGNSTGENYMFSGDEPSVFASYLIRFKVDSNIANPHYVWLQMRTKRWWDFVSGAKSGSAQAGANATVLGKFEVTLPPKNVQDYVVDVISCLSSKISLNTSTNQTLEEMAQAIFKSWFVDFDPVKAKMNGEQPEGMDAATASLFPEKLVESELGLIPEGWSVRPLGSLIDFMTGFAFKSKQFTESGVRLARGDNVKEGRFHWGDKSRYWPDVTPELEKYHLQSGDILIGMDGSKVGKNWVRVNESDLPCLLVQRVARLREKGLVGSSMLEVIIGGNKFKRYVENVKTGTSIPHISGKQIKDMPILYPNDGGKLFQRFEELLLPLAQKRELNNAENQELTRLRDTLLPKLLSGEIELGETEEMAEVN